MNPNLAQFNFRIPIEFRQDIINFCWSKRWNIQTTIKEWIRLGLLVAKHPEIHRELNQIIEKSKLVNIAEPDYVNLLISQYDDIERLAELKASMHLKPIEMRHVKPSQIFTHKEIAT